MSRPVAQPVSGMRDLLPRDAARRAYVIRAVQSAFQLYGFQPVETPAMERLSTLQGKYGEEGEQLMYKVLKRGRKLTQALASSAPDDALADMGLRYDLTVPLARLVAAHQQELLPVFKRYQIQPVYRAERPAQGRYREFMQCDVDIVGLESLDAEADVVNAGVSALQTLGFDPGSDFRLRLNHRAVLNGLLAASRVPPALHATALVAIDKADKIGAEGVERELAARGLPPASVQALLRVMSNLGGGQKPSAMHPLLAEVLADHADGQQGLQDLETLTALLDVGPAGPALRWDPLLARGMGYYTGPIYEVQFPDLASSGGGGGRYDELLGLFVGKRIPACGFSLGLERILLIMEARGMFPEALGQEPQVLVAQIDAAQARCAHQIAHRLRAEGLRTDLFPAVAGLRRQFRYAEKRGIRFVVIIGADEAQANQAALKDLDSGAQVTLAQQETGAHLKRLLRAQ